MDLQDLEKDCRMALRLALDDDIKAVSEAARRLGYVAAAIERESADVNAYADVFASFPDFNYNAYLALGTFSVSDEEYWDDIKRFERGYEPFWVTEEDTWERWYYWQTYEYDIAWHVEKRMQERGAADTASVRMLCLYAAACNEEKRLQGIMSVWNNEATRSVVFTDYANKAFSVAREIGFITGTAQTGYVWKRSKQIPKAALAYFLYKVYGGKWPEAELCALFGVKHLSESLHQAERAKEKRRQKWRKVIDNILPNKQGGE